MTKQHKATPDDWAQQEYWASRCAFSNSSCILELRDRIEALEAAQQPPRDKLDWLIALDRDDPTNSLVDRIATDAKLCKVYNDAPEHGFGPALRAVYDLGREHGAAPTQPGPESSPAGSLVDRIKRRLIKGLGGTWEEASCNVIREVAAWLKQEGYSTLQAEALEQEANR
jgi:hypothetical protein